MQNHYFIGIGGTGGNVLREIRKTLYVRTKAKEAINCEYLYVDSHMAELDQEADWRVLGNSVQLPPNQRMLIKDGQLAKVMKNLGQYPTISPWVGDRDFLDRVLERAAGIPGAQQRRRFGRFLFAIHAPAFVDRLRYGVGGLIAGRKADCTFHLFGTLGGGTGSGGLLDAAIQIRHAFPDAASYPVKLYCTITDNAMNPEADAGYFYPNQYAALRDINALLAATETFDDVLSVEKVVTREPALQVCYLVTDRNALGRSVPKQRQERIIAEWVVQTCEGQARNAIDQLVGKKLTGEDISVSYSGEPLNAVERSYKFASLGIRRWSIPQEQIRELIACQVASALTLLVLNPRGGDGLAGEQETDASKRFMAENPPSGQRISAQNLADPRSAGDMEIDAEWSFLIENAIGGDVDEKSLGTALRASSDFTNNSFRGLGVARFFLGHQQQAAAVAKDIVDATCAKIEQAIVQGAVGFHDAFVCLNAYAKAADAELLGLKQQLSGKAMERSEAQRQITEAETRWDNIGPLSNLFGARKRILEEAKGAIVARGAAETWEKGYELARDVLQRLASGMRAAANNVAQLRTALMNAKAGIDRSAKAAEGYLGDQGGATGMRDDLMKVEWDQDSLAGFRQWLLGSSVSMAQAVREARLAILGGPDKEEEGRVALRVPLAQMGSRADVAMIQNSLINAADRACTERHAEFVNENAGRRVLDENIVGFLQRRHGGEISEALRKEIEGFVRDSVTLMQVRSSEAQPGQLLGRSTQRMPRQALVVMLPEAANREFRAVLEDAFKASCDGGTSVHCVSTDEVSEITILAVDSWFAARFSMPSVGLKAKYLEASARETLEVRYFANLDDRSHTLPDLFLADGAQVRALASRWFEIGRRVEVLKVDRDGNLVLLQTDKDGITIVVSYGPQTNVLNLPDVDLQKKREEVRTMVGKVGVERLEAVDRDLLRELQELPKKVDPVNYADDYQKQCAELQEIRKLVQELVAARKR